jgi:hypothetical protein
MTRRRPCPPAPGPLEAYPAALDPVFASLAQRRGVREYLQGLLLPRDRNNTLTALAGAEPVVGAQGAAVQRLQWLWESKTQSICRGQSSDTANEVWHDRRAAAHNSVRTGGCNVCTIGQGEAYL